MLDDDNIDIISDHFYPMVQPNHHLPILKRMSKLSSMVAGKKPLLIGEMGMVMPEYLEKIFEVCIYVNLCCYRSIYIHVTTTQLTFLAGVHAYKHRL